MARAPDFLSGELFPRIPQPAALDSPAMDLKVRIAHAMAESMKACTADRFEIAARMSRILGRDVSKNMLDAYAAASKDTHVPNLAFCIAFDAATGQRGLLNLYAALSGCSVLVGEDALRAEIVRLESQEDEIRKKKRALRNFINRSTR